jgi:hypothetical protein
MTRPSPTPMTSPLPPHAPKLPSPRVSAILAAAMLAAGIAAGALIGPGPAASLTGTRAAAIGRALALLALGSASGAGSGPLLSAGAAHPPAPAPAVSSEATAGSGGSGGSGSASKASKTSSSSSSSSPSSHSGSTSPTSSTKPPAGGEEEERHTPLPPIASAWVIVLPYGGAAASALATPAAAPYLAQLRAQGTVLSAYTSLAADQLAGAATLLSGQVGANVTTLAPPPCAATGASTEAGQPGEAPCPSGEPAGVQAANAFLQAVVPAIVASPAYTEHGLIAIAFASATSAAQPATSYPAGALAGTVTAAGVPAGALLLSPFLRHAGARSSSTFEPASPRTSLEGLVAAPKTTIHQ